MSNEIPVTDGERATAVILHRLEEWEQMKPHFDAMVEHLEALTADSHWHCSRERHGKIRELLDQIKEREIK